MWRCEAQEEGCLAGRRPQKGVLVRLQVVMEAGEAALAGWTPTLTNLEKRHAKTYSFLFCRATKEITILKGKRYT